MAFARLSIDRLLALRKLPDFDVILLYREIFPIGPAVVERLLARRGHPPIVFDFDDAIFLPAVSHANRFISALKYPGKVKTIIRSADHVITGNDYLASYAEQYNRSVTTIPTCVYTDRFVPRADGARSATPPVVGWIGSPTTAIYIADLAPVLRRVAETDAFVARISGAGAAIEMPGVRMENARWSLDDEVRLFNTCDIGVYPLTDDEWSRGKCGFKAIQFMACGVPVVGSAAEAVRRHPRRRRSPVPAVLSTIPEGRRRTTSARPRLARDHEGNARRGRRCIRGRFPQHIRGTDARRTAPSGSCRHDVARDGADGRTVDSEARIRRLPSRHPSGLSRRVRAVLGDARRQSRQGRTDGVW